MTSMPGLSFGPPKQEKRSVKVENMKKALINCTLLIGMSVSLIAQTENQAKMSPVIDVHLHVGPVRPALELLCPQFLSDMPGAYPLDETPFDFRVIDFLDTWPEAQSEEEM